MHLTKVPYKYYIGFYNRVPSKGSFRGTSKESKNNRSGLL